MITTLEVDDSRPPNHRLASLFCYEQDPEQDDKQYSDSDSDKDVADEEVWHQTDLPGAEDTTGLSH